MKLRKGESATKYLGRLECQFRQLYGNRAAGEERRIKQQFVEGFIQDGHQLDPDDKRFCEVYANLTDMAIYAEKCMAKKLARLSNMRNNYTRKNINFVDTEGTPGMNGRYYLPINMMDQTQHEPQTQQIHPPPPSPPPRPFQPPPPLPQSHPFPPHRHPGFGDQGPRASYISSPRAVRVSLQEYLQGYANDGSRFCHRCLQVGHIAPDCVYQSACARCSNPPMEQGHTTRNHNIRLQRANIHQQDGPFPRNFDQRFTNNSQNNQNDRI